MKKKIEILLLFFILILYGCNSKQDSPKNKIEKKNIIVIFENIPQNWKLNLKKGYANSGKYEVSYNKSGFENYFWLPSYKKNIDTLIIRNVIGSIEFIHKYRGLDKFNYLFHAGDTIKFNYDSLLPIATVINRKTKKYDNSFEILKREKITNNDFPSFVKYNSFRNFFVDEKDRYVFDKKLDSLFKKQQKEKAKNEFIQEYKILDSLLQNSLISKNKYDFYTQKIFYQKQTFEIENNNFNLLKQENDSMLKYSFYRAFLKSFIKNKIEKNVKILKSSNGSSPDYRIVFDSIKNSLLLGKYEKKYLLFIYMENIINTSSNTDINKYFTKYKKNKDTIRINYLTKIYNLKDSISNEIQLLDKENKKTTLKDVLNNNKGKVIYIDFWASWCAPCRKSMPSSKKLKLFYKNKDITFIYLAFNDRFNKWEDASKKEGLENFKHNLFISNSKSSQLIEDLKINTIPRFLIYDKNGKLVHKNAPNPNSEELKKILNKYLNQ